jgi:LacI family transcriptional regulator
LALTPIYHRIIASSGDPDGIMKYNRRVRLEDIAIEVGLTKVSVSKALRDHPDIAYDTKVRVREVAERLGYTPNLVARSLSSRRSNMIGVIVPKVAHSFFSLAIEAIYARASQSNYEIIMCVSHEDPRIERKHIDTLLGMRVDGILASVSEGTTDPRPFNAIMETGVPLVLFDRAIEGLEVSRVTVDDRKGAAEGVSHLIQAGHRSIAHLAGYSAVTIGRERRLGYEDALREAGISVASQKVIEGGFSEADGYLGFKKLLNSGPLPEAIFAVTFPVGLGAYDAALDAGISLDAFTLLTFGGSSMNRFLGHPMTYIDQPAREMGTRAASILIDQIEARKTGRPQHLVLPTRLQLPGRTALDQQAETVTLI